MSPTDEELADAIGRLNTPPDPNPNWQEDVFIEAGRRHLRRVALAVLAVVAICGLIEWLWPGPSEPSHRPPIHGLDPRR